MVLGGIVTIVEHHIRRKRGERVVTDVEEAPDNNSRLYEISTTTGKILIGNKKIPNKQKFITQLRSLFF